MKKYIIILFVLVLSSGCGTSGLVQHEESPTVYHNSADVPRKVFDEAYEDINSPLPPLWKRGGEAQAAGVLVNHHLLAANFIAEAFQYVATSAPVTVILISPDHFFAGKKSIGISRAIWRTPYGEVKPDEQLISNLIRLQPLPALPSEGEGENRSLNSSMIDEAPFDLEHGISGIVPFIKRSLPNARVVPVIVKDTATTEQVDMFLEALQKIAPQDAIILGSFDFSHYLPSEIAEFHDISALQAVRDFEFDGVKNLDVDSRAGLYLFLKLLKSKHATAFNLLEHSNSAELTGQKDVLETTSYITGVFRPDAGADIIRQQRAVDNRPYVTFLSFGNFISSDGIESAIKAVYQPGTPFEFIKRIFLGQDITQSYYSGQVNALLEKWGVNNFTENKTNAIRGRDVNTAVLLPGETCKGISTGAIVTIPGNPNKQLARQCADAGARLVIFKNNLPMQGVEVYKNSLITYGQGDSLSAESLAKGSAGFALGAVFEDGAAEYRFFPFAITGGTARLLVGKERRKILLEISKNSSLSAADRARVAEGVINLK